MKVHALIDIDIRTSVCIIRVFNMGVISFFITHASFFIVIMFSIYTEVSDDRSKVNQLLA